MPCSYCGGPTTILRSHVVPKFVIRYCRANSVGGALLYSWEREFHHEQITGPYLCSNCDNVVFSQWENHFSRDVFADPMTATHQWGNLSTLRFLASLVFRCALHNLRVAPTAVNQTQNELFRDRAKAAAADPAQFGNQLFVYPFVFRPITRTYVLMPGVNSFLTTGFHSRVHHAEGTLPNCMMVRLPRILLLYSEADLTRSGDPDFARYTDLRPGVVFNPSASNTGMPEAFAPFINQGINETIGHQRSYGWWQRWINRADQRLFPARMVYQARTWDAQHRDWQHANAPSQP
ncbi:MAG: hypothetical protein JWN70_2371 [Planctomycetaceae bacterium]|nr:hypothetical protein [Planctomycetaceae bacterium]